MQASVPAIHMNFPEYATLHHAYPAFLLLDRLDANVLAQIILSTINDQQGYQKMVDACQLGAKDLIWEKEEQKLISFYDQIFKVKGKG